MPKISCSSENCNQVWQRALRDYYRGEKGKRLRKPMPSPYGKLQIETIQRPQGLAVKITRCNKLSYIHKVTRDPTTDTCTRTRTIPVPDDTLRCYRQISPALKGAFEEKRGRSRGISNRVFALIACSKSGRFKSPCIKEPIVPAVIAAVIKQPDEKIEKLHRQVKDNIELLKKQRRLIGDEYIKDIGEKSVKLPPPYQSLFDQYVQTHQTRPEGAVMPPPPEQWELRRFRHRAVPIIRKGKGLPKDFKWTEKALLKAAQAEEDWRRKTRIVTPRYRTYIPDPAPKRMKNETAEKYEKRLAKYNERMRKEGKVTQTAKILRAPKRPDYARTQGYQEAVARQREREETQNI